MRGGVEVLGTQRPVGQTLPSKSSARQPLALFTGKVATTPWQSGANRQKSRCVVLASRSAGCTTAMVLIVEAVELFLDTMGDLRRRTDLRATEYDVVQSAGLVRRLVLDQQPLLHKVNRELRFKPELSWSRVRIAVPADNGSVWVPLLWLDPVLGARLLERVQAALGHAGDHPVVWDGNLDAFLKHPVMLRDGRELTVQVLLRHYANREGGVHHDDRPPDSDLLGDVLAQSEEAARLTALACTRIIYRALEPLAVALHLRANDYPAGLDLTGSIFDEAPDAP